MLAKEMKNDCDTRGVSGSLKERRVAADTGSSADNGIELFIRYVFLPDIEGCRGVTLARGVGRQILLDRLT